MLASAVLRSEAYCITMNFLMDMHKEKLKRIQF